MRFLKYLMFVVFVLAVPLVSQAATIEVTTETDEIDPTGDGCSLREALIAVNSNGVLIDPDCTNTGEAFGTDDTISIPSGTYTLTIPGAGNNDGGTGDLDILVDVNLRGDMATSTILQAGTDVELGIDRVIDIRAGATVEMSNLTIRHGNISAGGGGGIVVCNTCTLNLSDSLIMGNQSDGDGGGIENDGVLTIANSTVSDNLAANNAGGIANSGTLTITDGTISGNTASSGDGGAIEHTGGTLTIERTTFSGNSTLVGDGGAIETSADAVFLNTTFSGNTAADDGGGISNFAGAAVTILNNTFHGNSAVEGGALSSASAGSVITLKNTIVANTVSGGNCNAFSNGTITTLGNNLEDEDSCGFDAGMNDQVNTDPLLGSLQAIGGVTEVHPLLAGSPAIDAIAGDCTDDMASSINDDQRLFLRPVDGDGDGDADCDVGAVEVGTCGDGVVDVARDEACDDGNTTDGDGCAADCTNEADGGGGGGAGVCGDGVVDAGEECDDGNTDDGDGCAADCTGEGTTNGSSGGGCSLIPGKR